MIDLEYNRKLILEDGEEYSITPNSRAAPTAPIRCFKGSSQLH